MPQALLSNLDNLEIVDKHHHVTLLYTIRTLLRYTFVAQSMRTYFVAQA
jgi:hypothetical protein